MTDHSRSDRIALVLFVLAVAGALFIYGVAVGRYQLFPFALLEQIHGQTREALTGESDSWVVRSIDDRGGTPVTRTAGAWEGLNLVTRFVSETEFRAEIVDMDGEIVHAWNTDWFEIWPDADHLPDRRVPRSPPGTHIHGAVVLPDGDLVFNFEHLGLVRLDVSGRVEWRLPYPTHHSVTVDEAGNLWVSGEVDIAEDTDRFPQRTAPFREHTALVVSPDGEILDEWSVADLLMENGYAGLLHLGTTENNDMRVGNADLLHLNDVEPFPDSFEEGFFRRGDVMVSLRNVNTVLVFNRDSREIRFVDTGRYVRQHDPDFLDGDRFSVYDNHNVGPESHGQQSRILIVDAAEGTIRVHFEGNATVPFYSEIMGKHQWLPNGNLLIV